MLGSKQTNNQRIWQYSASKRFIFYQQMYYQLFLFVVSFMAIDAVLICSQYWKLFNILFEILLTQFNAMLMRQLNFQIQSKHTIYFTSGLFVLGNQVVKYVLLDSFILTFTINYVLMLFIISKAFLQKKLYFLAGYIVYIVLFGTIEGLLPIDIRLPMLIPVVLFFGMLFQQIRRISQVLEEYELNKNKKIIKLFLIAQIGIQLIDSCVFAVTLIPLYHTYISSDLVLLSLFAQVLVACTVLYLITYPLEMVMYGYQCDNETILPIAQRSATTYQNLFLVPKQYSHFEFRQKQLCFYCCHSEAMILNQPCKHQIVCVPCMIRLLKKRRFNCLICGKQIMRASVTTKNIKANLITVESCYQQEPIFYQVVLSEIIYFFASNSNSDAGLVDHYFEAMAGLVQNER